MLYDLSGYYSNSILELGVGVGVRLFVTVFANVLFHEGIILHDHMMSA